MNITFTSDSPCRCGFDGTGIHQCHAGRLAGDRCKNAAEPFFTANVAGLAGVQAKFGATVVCYCRDCAKKAGFTRNDSPSQ